MSLATSRTVLAAAVRVSIASLGVGAHIADIATAINVRLSTVEDTVTAADTTAHGATLITIAIVVCNTHTAQRAQWLALSTCASTINIGFSTFPQTVRAIPGIGCGTHAHMHGAVACFCHTIAWLSAMASHGAPTNTVTTTVDIELASILHPIEAAYAHLPWTPRHTIDFTHTRDTIRRLITVTPLSTTCTASSTIHICLASIKKAVGTRPAVSIVASAGCTVFIHQALLRCPTASIYARTVDAWQAERQSALVLHCTDV